MENSTAIDRVRALFTKRDSQDYERLVPDEIDRDEDVRRPVLTLPDSDEGEPFSWFEYSIFLLLGVAMLWAW